MAAIRAAIPGTLVGISTGAWIERDDDRRLAHMAAWRELPDYASVNLSELEQISSDRNLFPIYRMIRT